MAGRPSSRGQAASEATITKRIQRMLKSRGAWQIKYFPGLYGTRGVPDLLVCYRGRFVALEVKNAYGQVSDTQAIQMRKLREAGAYVETVRSVEDAEGILDEIDRTGAE